MRLSYCRRSGEWEGICAQPPGDLLLDISMPMKSGLAVLKEVMPAAGLRLIPMIMLTTGERDQDILTSYVAGSSAFVWRPVRLDEIQKVCKQFQICWPLVELLPGLGP